MSSAQSKKQAVNTELPPRLIKVKVDVGKVETHLNAIIRETDRILAYNDNSLSLIAVWLLN